MISPQREQPRQRQLALEWRIAIARVFQQPGNVLLSQARRPSSEFKLPEIGQPVVDSLVVLEQLDCAPEPDASTLRRGLEAGTKSFIVEAASPVLDACQPDSGIHHVDVDAPPRQQLQQSGRR